MAKNSFDQVKWVTKIFVAFIVFLILLALLYDDWDKVVVFLSPVHIGDSDFPLFAFMCYLFGYIFFFGIIIATITNLIRTAGDRYVQGTAHYTFYNHILFLGYDEMMVGTLKKELLDEPTSEIVVAVPANAAEVRNAILQQLSSIEAKRVVVIQATRTKMEDLQKRAYVQRSKRVYVIGQPDEPSHDANNLKALGLIATLCVDNHKGPFVMYYMRNAATFSLMQRQDLPTEYLMGSVNDKSGKTFSECEINKYVKSHCEPFNFYEAVARRLLFNLEDVSNTIRLDWHSPTKNLIKQPTLQPHLVVVGMTEMGTALAKEVLLTSYYPDCKLKITFVDERAYDEMLYFIGRHDILFDQCNYAFHNLDDPTHDKDHTHEVKDFLGVELEFIQCNVAHPELKRLLRKWAVPDGNSLTTLAVCLNDTPQAMAFALYLDRIVLENVPIWVYQKEDAGMGQLLDHTAYKNINLFSLKDMAVAVPGRSFEYEWAKEVAETYERYYGNTSKKWCEFDSYGRWSSLYNAMSIIVKLRLAGYGLCKDALTGKLVSYDIFDSYREHILMKLTDDQKWHFSNAEHSRWIVEKLMAGFSPISDKEADEYFSMPDVSKEDKDRKKAKKDEYVGNFTHPDLRAFEVLPPKEQKKDYRLVECLVELINNGGRSNPCE